MLDQNGKHLVSLSAHCRTGKRRGQGVGLYLLVIAVEEFLVTDCGEHFGKDLACKDSVFGAGDFADLFLLCLAAEPFCLSLLGPTE